MNEIDVAEVDKIVITCALNGVLTDPRQHKVPVTPDEMAAEARRAYDAGAAVVHIHLRQQGVGKGHLPSWNSALSQEVQDAIRQACPGILINHTTGISGSDFDEVLDCLRHTRPEMAACNAGSLNYLRLKSDGTWAWPPYIFDNSVEKVTAFVGAMEESGSLPEFECFDIGIVRCVSMYRKAGIYRGPLSYNFVMGVASGMPADDRLLPILLDLKEPDATWQTTVIGRSEVWKLHRAVAEAGGHLRAGLEDSFYLPDGTRASSNGEMIDSLATIARAAGRSIASPEEARSILRMPAQP